MDDSLLLNFKTVSGTSNAPKKAVGKLKGTWKERLKVRKSLAPRTPKRQSNPSTIQTKDNEIKKVKPASIAPPIEKISPGPPPRPQKRLDDNTVLSSLWTSNPRVTLEESTALPTSKASNAPLEDGTFNGLPSPLIKALESRNIQRPTEIQRAVIPKLLAADKDLVAVAQTGSGKTLAYLLPILATLMSQDGLHRDSGVFAVILVPTRELAAQIHTLTENICQKACHWLVSGLVVGGEKKKSEKARLRKGVNILIGTPGRMADHFENTRSLDLRDVRYVVLDEGDRLVELGFEETITAIMERIASRQYFTGKYSKLPKSRVTMLCSATMSASINRLQTLTLRDPIWVHESDDKEAAPRQLQQDVLVVPAKLRLVTLAAMLRSVHRQRQKTMVFCSSGDSVAFHAAVFKRDWPNVWKLHGSLGQSERTRALSEFMNAPGGILFTTDVAARGLDAIVDNVIELDPPASVDEHLHRAGRTARAGRTGHASLFLLPSEEGYIELLKAVHADGVRTVGFGPLVEKAFTGGRDWQSEATTWQIKTERWILANPEIHQLALDAWQSHIRAYTTHPAAEREIFNMKAIHLGHLAKAFALRDVPSSGSRAKARSEESAPLKKKRKVGREAMLDAARRAAAGSDFNVL